jgi:hypothetical protein
MAPRPHASRLRSIRHPAHDAHDAKGPRVDDDVTIGHLKADVARFCAGLAAAAPPERLRLVALLRAALDEVTEQALADGIAAAASEGWPLRRIGDAVGFSHEKVRYLLARTAGHP